MVDLRAATADVQRLIPIIAQMGIEVVELDRNAAAARMPAGPNGNHFGVAYAGSLFTVAEVLGGLFTYTSLEVEGGLPLVRRMEIDFLRPATTDVTARAVLTDAEIQRVLAEYAEVGKSHFQLTTEVVDTEGVVVARTVGHYQLRRF